MVFFLWLNVHVLFVGLFRQEVSTGTLAISPHGAIGVSALISLPSDSMAPGDGPKTSVFATGGFDHTGQSFCCTFIQMCSKV